MEMKHKIREIVSYMCIFFGVLMICVILKVAAFAIPSEPVKANVEKSREMIVMSSDYPTLPMVNSNYEWKDRGWTIIDNYTEWVPVNAAYIADTSHPLYSAMRNANVRITEQSMAQNLLYAIDENVLDDQIAEAPQYWWGSISFIRPLLVFFDYSQIIVIFQIIAYSLLCWTCICLYKRGGGRLMVPFFLSLITISFLTTTYMIHFLMNYIIMFLCIIYICNSTKLKDSLPKLMLVSGMITSYLDWLSTPSITCTIPLAVAIIIFFLDNNEIEYIKNFLKIIIAGITWCIGYSLMMASKWIISALVMGDISESFMSRIIHDTSISQKFIPYYIETIKNSFDMFITNKIGINWIWFMLIGVALFAICKDIVKKKNVLKNLGLIIISFVPFLWPIVFKWHTHEHYWFTYRNFIITIFVILYFVCSINWKKLRPKNKNLINEGENVR